MKIKLQVKSHHAIDIAALGIDGIRRTAELAGNPNKKEWILRLLLNE